MSSNGETNGMNKQLVVRKPNVKWMKNMRENEKRVQQKAEDCIMVNGWTDGLQGSRTE